MRPSPLGWEIYSGAAAPVSTCKSIRRMRSVQDSVLPWGCGAKPAPASPPPSFFSLHPFFSLFLLTLHELLLTPLLSSYSTLRTPHFSLLTQLAMLIL